MNIDDLLEKIFKLQQTISERESRLEIQINDIGNKVDNQTKRLDKIDSIIARMSETVNEQKHLTTIIDRLSLVVSSHETALKEYDERIKTLANAPSRWALSIWRKIGVLFLGACISGLTGAILLKIGMGG